MRQLVAMHKAIQAQREELVATLARKFPKGCLVRVDMKPHQIEYVVAGYLAPCSSGFGSLIGVNPNTHLRKTFHFTKIKSRRFARELPVPVELLEDAPCE